MKILVVVKTRRTRTCGPRRWRWDWWWYWVVLLLWGISVPQPQPPRPTLVCRHQKVILFNTKKMYSQNSIQFITHNLTLHKFLHLFFFQTQCVTRSGKVDDMVTNLQRYPYFAITNETPYASFVVNMGNGKYANIFCNDGPDHVDSRQTWTASTRIACIVSRMDATLFPPQTSTSVKCTPYLSVPGTTYSIFSILMKGDDACCVVSNQYGTTQKCPWTKRWNEVEILVGCDAMRERNDDDEN